MWLRPSKEVCKDETHYKKGKQGGKHTPEHAEIGALIFLFEISFYELRKKKSVLFKFLN